MKSFKSLVMTALIAVFLCAGVVGCSMFEAINNNPAAADLVIKIAVTQYVDAAAPEDRLERARSVDVKVAQFQDALAGNPSLSLDGLEQQFRDSIDWNTLDLSDKILADALIHNVRLQLESRVDIGQVSPDYSIAAKTLLVLIRNAAGLYGV